MVAPAVNAIRPPAATVQLPLTARLLESVNVAPAPMLTLSNDALVTAMMRLVPAPLMLTLPKS